MPASSDDTYLESDHELSVTAHMLPGGRRAQVCLAGEMDMAASTVLSGTIRLADQIGAGQRAAKSR